MCDDTLGVTGLDLPQLRRLKFYHMEIRDDSDFGPSLARSPELLLVDGYKVSQSPDFLSGHMDDDERCGLAAASRLAECRLSSSPRGLNHPQVWGLGGQPHYLHLENCVHFKLARSDDLESLDMYAPRLETLYLAACFSLTRLRVHQHKLEPDKVRRA